MGGALSAALATSDPEPAGSIIFYGRPPVSGIANIQCPILGFYSHQYLPHSLLSLSFYTIFVENKKRVDWICVILLKCEKTCMQRRAYLWVC